MDSTNFHTRYNRQIILKGFGVAAQQKLADAKVLVVGAGGLGCPAVQYLVAAGVGTVGLVDDDTVSLSNLHRQVLYTTDDVGQPKALIAAERLRRMNPDVTVVPHNIRLEASNALDILKEYDVVVDGTDNFASRYLINDACVLLGKPLVYGAVSQYEGQVAVFNVANEEGAAVHYRHLFPEPPKHGEVANCAEAGVLGVLPGIIGAMQATEAIKLLTGIGEPLTNRLLTYNALTQETYALQLAHHNLPDGLMPTTPEAFLQTDYEAACGAKPFGVVEIDAEEFHRLRQQPSSTVIDVRETGEKPSLNGLPHRQLPMSVFEEEMSGIKEETVLLVCQHGIRSLHAAEMLQESSANAKRIFSLKGGVAKWAAALGIE